MMYLATLFYVKISILAFYRRLSPARGYQIALKLCGTAVALYTVGMILVNVSAAILIFTPWDSLTPIHSSTGLRMPKEAQSPVVPNIPRRMQQHRSGAVRAVWAQHLLGHRHPAAASAVSPEAAGQPGQEKYVATP